VVVVVVAGFSKAAEIGLKSILFKLPSKLREDRREDSLSGGVTLKSILEILLSNRRWDRREDEADALGGFSCAGDGDLVTLVLRVIIVVVVVALLRFVASFRSSPASTGNPSAVMEIVSCGVTCCKLDDHDEQFDALLLVDGLPLQAGSITDVGDIKV
jgi:hypothetical protein